jgi:hypothetical protein
VSRTVNHLIQRQERDAAIKEKGEAQTACGVTLKTPRIGLDLPTCPRCERVVAKLKNAARVAWDEGYGFGVMDQMDGLRQHENPYRSEK